MSTALEAGTAYHAHLEQCSQCREHPFAQCPEGARLLLAVGEVATGITGATLRGQAKPAPRKPRRKNRRRRDGKGKRRKR